MGEIEQRHPIFLGSFFLGHPRSEPSTFEATPSLDAATRLGTYTGLAGIIGAAIKHGVITPAEANKGYIANVTKFGAFAAAIGFTYGGITQSVASIRQENDPWNAAAGGCAAGFLLGIRAGQLPMALGQCAIWGAAAGGVHYAGNTLVPANHHKSKEQQQLERVKLLGDHTTRG